MRPILVACLALLLAGPALAQPSPLAEADRGAIQGVIRGQLDAFQHDDAAGAFRYAAPNIQTMFGSADTFLGMVRRGYQPVYRPRSVDFTTLTAEDGVPMQSVEVIGPDGLAYTALYSMEREPDGTWRISGCSLLESRRVGT